MKTIVLLAALAVAPVLHAQTQWKLATGYRAESFHTRNVVQFAQDVERASGGALRDWPLEALAQATVKEALAHPNWAMGQRITIDSASMFNKALEVIEARWLFGLAPEQIRVVLHPQSIIHSMVVCRDRSVLAQLGNPDMRTAIAYGLAWPERIDSGVAPLDLAALARFDFEAPDLAAFPCLALAFRALEAGGTAPAVLNAANEIAVSAFLQGELGFLGIPDLIQACLDAMPASPAGSLEDLMATDAEARRIARALVAKGRAS